MGLDKKFRIFLILGALIGLAGEGYCLANSGPGMHANSTVFLVLWLLSCIYVQKFMFRCPHCHEYSLFFRASHHFQFPGNRCRYCGLDY